MVKGLGGLFIAKGNRTKECLELMHTDVYGTFVVHTWGKLGGFITSINEYSRFGYVYLVHGKFDALNTFIEFKVESDNLLSKHIKSLRLDLGGMHSRFDSFLGSMGLFPKFYVHQGLHCKCNNGKKKSNFDRNGKIKDWFFITSHNFLGIYLRDSIIPSLPKRYISL